MRISKFVTLRLTQLSVLQGFLLLLHFVSLLHSQILYSLVCSVTSGGVILHTTLVNIILVIRLNALYQIFYGKRGLRRCQVFLASVVTELIVCIKAVTWMQGVIEPPAEVPWPGCMISENPDIALTLPGWGITILVATIFLGLTLYLLYSSMRSRFERFGDFTISNIKREIQNVQPMTLTMIRDRILVASVPVTVLYPTALYTVTSPYVSTLYSFCASRLIIHTRESFARAFQDVSSRDTQPITFAPRASHVEMHA
ncbi:hypothetical protein EDD15DRAFT_2313704 [Pisolithus albus]|nr:hypothetical protein EDD15DRAFT_2313704 [Pisolithus albus]